MKSTLNVAAFCVAVAASCSILVLLPPATLAVEFVVTGARLPAPLELQSAVYDGDDSIYLIGGYDGLRQDAVLKYSLGSGTVERVGTFERISQGEAMMYNEQIIYFGGKVHLEGYTRDVYSYNTRYNNYTVINQLPIAMRSMTMGYDHTRNIAYGFGGINNNGFTYHNYILRYNPVTNQLDQVGVLPEGRGAATAVFTDAGVGYIFGGTVPINHESMSDEILKFDPFQNTVTKLTTKLPSLVYYSSSVLANDGNIYIVGQFDLLRFNPATETVETLQLAGWPNYLLGAPSVFVPKLNRVYIFGGYGRYNGDFPQDRVEISYVDVAA